MLRWFENYSSRYIGTPFLAASQALQPVLYGQILINQTKQLKHNIMKKTLWLLMAFTFSFSLKAQEDCSFRNPDISLDERAECIVKQLTVEEKINQLMNAAPAVDRLEIPEYDWWNECLHGVARAGRATVFPQAIALAATWDTTLMYRVGDAISTEARAKYNVFSKHGYRGQYQGLTFWTPNVNIFRDPRWGRGQETYGEDPFLTSRIGVSFVKGLQGNHPKYLKVAALAKHYAVHNGPEALRHEFDAKVSMKDLWETYLPAFEALVKEARVEGVMGAYNRTNGNPCCAHPYLMQEVLREKWGFDGYYVSDCGAIMDFYTGHNIVDTPEEAAAMALNAGCNLNCGNTYASLLKSLEKGLTTEEEIDKSVKQLFKTRLRLGLFAPEGDVPYDTICTDVIRSKEHQELALEAARKSVVLLKNEANTLPVARDVKKVYVTGPTATHVQALLANYYGVSEDMTTILEGIVGKVSPQTSVQYRQGALLDAPNRNSMDWFSGAAASADVTVACLGISQLIEGEEGEAIASEHKGDRVRTSLPQNQIDFLKQIRASARKLVVVITSGSAISVPEIYDMADALLYVWYPGEQGGKAVADVLFGDAVPSGRLPVTVVKSVDDLPPYETYDMTGRTYRYMEIPPQFPFGFGLSYTDFTYSNLTLESNKVKSGEPVKLSFQLTNEGQYDADEVVQFYITDVEASVNVPKQSLIGFKRVGLAAGESKRIEFTVTPDMMKIVNKDGGKILEPGEFKIYVGGASYSEVNDELGAAEGLTDYFEVL
ncbi:MAG: beta-glucosidase [Anaerophaga sp.]|nr:beta-glucosidase [Anaerophaga sp.]